MIGICIVVCPRRSFWSVEVIARKNSYQQKKIMFFTFYVFLEFFFISFWFWCTGARFALLFQILMDRTTHWTQNIGIHVPLHIYGNWCDGFDETSKYEQYIILLLTIWLFHEWFLKSKFWLRSTRNSLDAFYNKRIFSDHTSHS